MNSVPFEIVLYIIVIISTFEYPFEQLLTLFTFPISVYYFHYFHSVLHLHLKLAGV